MDWTARRISWDRLNAFCSWTEDHKRALEMIRSGRLIEAPKPWDSLVEYIRKIAEQTNRVISQAKHTVRISS